MARPFSELLCAMANEDGVRTVGRVKVQLGVGQLPRRVALVVQDDLDGHHLCTSSATSVNFTNQCDCCATLAPPLNGFQTSPASRIVAFGNAALTLSA